MRGRQGRMREIRGKIEESLEENRRKINWKEEREGKWDDECRNKRREVKKELRE